ncbi:MATH domain and coiled-coil domain-containing protein At3g58360-like [Vicia villosa]|uniref:MATH domain and coiled-coil domain-containing protein At3g58360-like n=1 Tax=Vicia villosa TaxID=3911 RepID=UPI00273AEC65|nr:MATH domain and coiled-coil domain-containing protein At3g58360-like [Vicia villosa]
MCPYSLVNVELYLCIKSLIGVKFTWKVENFSCLNTTEVYSEPFVLGGFPWKISMFPKGNKIDDYLSIYSEVMETANMSEGWNIYAKCKSFVFNQLDPDMTIIRDSDIDEFSASHPDWGWESFMPLVELHDPEKGFIVNDVCIIGVEVFVSKSSQVERVTQTASIIFECPNLKALSPHTIEPTKQDAGELVSDALGKILYFLKTKKVKDMNEHACKKLQDLWDVLEKFKFDVSWLEPSFQSAMGMKSLVEKATQVKKLKDIVVALELETGKIKAKLAAAEINLDVERGLLKAKGFKDIDFDSKLECGSWRA